MEEVILEPLLDYQRSLVIHPLLTLFN